MRKAKLLMVCLVLSLSLNGLPQAAAGEASMKGSRTGRNQNASAAGASLVVQRSGAGGNLRFVPRRITERNRRLKYTIKASYPQIVGAKNASAEQFNRLVKELITAEADDFKKDFEPPDSGLPPELQESSFDVGYRIEHRGTDLISVSFGISVYNAGAAHPNHYSRVLNYDLGAGRALKLSDLFKPRSNYLQTISAFTIKELKKKLGSHIDSDWIERGAAPDSENYKSWNITSRGLVITFDPYQVASYADGEQIVTIPYAALNSVINMDSPVAPLAKKVKSHR